jgi:hypothetical protein
LHRRASTLALATQKRGETVRKLYWMVICTAFAITPPAVSGMVTLLLPSGAKKNL